MVAGLKFAGLAVLGLTLALPVSRAHAAAEMIVNGNFESTSLTSSRQFTGSQVTGWSNAATSGYTGNGYNFLIQPGTADTTGFTSNGGNLDRLWGPGNGVGSANYSANGMTATSPVGGNYILADGDANFRGAISQTVNNLSVGSTYLLSFYWAAAQFAPYNGATTESWQVTFGSNTQSTPVVALASHGFTPWTQQTFAFTATAASQVLSFLAVGTPNGTPPSSLLDGVSLVAAPEPASAALILVGLLGFAAVTWHRGRRSAV